MSEDKNKQSQKWERVVVDEIFENGTVRLLRAKRLEGMDDNDFGIESWGDERENFMSTWIVKAFVGFPSRRHLREGDVFFIRDGSKLNRKYGKKPLPLKVAKKLHMLKDWEDSRELARQEIKAEFARLSAVSISSGDEKGIRKLHKLVDQKFKEVEEIKTKGEEHHE